MTEEYRNELFSRISRLKYTYHVYVKKTAQLVIICVFSLLCGYFLHFLSLGEKENINAILNEHFCNFFEGLGAMDCIRAAVSFALTDLIPIMVIMILGYTMISGIGGKIILCLYSLRLGWCGAFIYDFLIGEPVISGGTGAFVLFTLCKFSVLTALIFAALRSEDFSYKFGEIFGKKKHPYTEKQSFEYIKALTSTAGFTALINTIYLIFQSLSDLSLL
ncbi:MAG: hypothetical protein IJZ89_06395 [Clostridia bacterium]|nr:hypothetical protein [Clostridia bacterium]